jgi:hypothetical protein
MIKAAVQENTPLIFIYIFDLSFQIIEKIMIKFIAILTPCKVASYFFHVYRVGKEGLAHRRCCVLPRLQSTV